MKEYVRGKDIILVGNSLDALEKTHGATIDDYDITVRFGKGLPEPRTFDRIGTNTHIWVTGQLRMHMLPKVLLVTKVLFNESLYSERLGRPSCDYCSMYDNARIMAIADEFGIADNKRLSAGAQTAHWFANVCNTWGSLTLIYFDGFTKHTKFFAESSNSYQHTSSWHLPLLRAEYVDPNYSIEDGCPAHDTNCEIAVLNSVLALPNVHWIGEPLNKSNELVENPSVKYTAGRWKTAIEADRTK